MGVGATHDSLGKIAAAQELDRRISPLGRLHLMAYLAVALLVCANLGLSIYGGVTYWWRIPFLDMIEPLQDYFDLPFWKFLIKPDNEHVQIVGKALYALDFNLFHATGGFLVLASWAFAGATGLVIASAASRSSVPEKQREQFWGFLALSLMLFVWMANWANLLWPHQVIIYSSVFLFVVSAWLYARWSEFPPGSKDAIWAIGLMCLSVFSFGYGAAGAITMLLILLLQRAPWKLTLAAGACLAIAIGACRWLIHSIGTGTYYSPFPALAHLDAVAAYLVVFFSAPMRSMMEPVVGAEAARIFSELVSVTGLFASELVLLSAFRRGIGSAARGFALSLVIYGLGNGLITSLARLTLNDPLASRYFVIPVLFWVGLIMLGTTSRQSRPERMKVALLGAALLALSLITNWQIRWLSMQAAPQWSDTEMALLNGVDTPASLAPIWPGDWSIVNPGRVFEILRQRDWSIFHQPIAHVIGKPGLTVFYGTTTGCVGHVDQIQRVAGMPDAFRITGWAYDTQTRSHIRDIVFLGRDRIIKGVGRTLFGRDDVQKARPDIFDPLTGWLGFVRTNGVSAQTIDSYAVVQRSGRPTLCRV